MDFSKWYRLNDKSNANGFVIKRYAKVDGKTKWETLSRKHYKGLSDDEIEALLRRLNATHEVKEQLARERYDFDHAYVNVNSLTKFEEYISSGANDRDHIKNTMKLLTDYVVEFFVIKQKLADPNQWFRKEVEWGKWLIEKELAVSSIKRIVGTANRYLTFISTRLYPDMGNPRLLEPPGRNKLKSLAPAVDKTKGYITPEKYKQVLTHAERVDPVAVPFIKLCRALGLRISETQGLTKEKFFKSHVLVDEQGDKVVGEGSAKRVTRKRLKTLDQRKVPYWYTTPQEAWQLVKALAPMSPTTLNKRVNAVLAKFGLESHDFRRTFITDSLRGHHWRDVQKAVGHTDVRTTMSYARDDRGLDDERMADLD